MLADAEALDNGRAFIEFYEAEVFDDEFVSAPIGPHRKALLQVTGPAVARETNGQLIWEQVRRLMLLGIEGQ